MNKRTYWNTYAASYSREWNGMAFRKLLNEQEDAFITGHIRRAVSRTSRARYIDIGSGYGRIIEMIRHADPRYRHITGLDVSEEMIRKASAANAARRAVSFVRTDIEATWPGTVRMADVITCIRVLKYVRDPKRLFGLISRHLKPGGISILTATNAGSVARFDGYAIGHFPVTVKTITDMAHESDMDVLEVTGHQKLPEFLYIAAEKMGFLPVIYAAEGLLRSLLGPVTGARILYIALKKRP